MLLAPVSLLAAAATGQDQTITPIPETGASSQRIMSGGDRTAEF